MKKGTQFWISLILVLFLIPNAWAYEPEKPYVNKAAEKLGRGLVNIVFSPVEITSAIESNVAAGNPYKTALLAPMEGALKMIGRVFVGSYEAVTFFVPQDPILKPAYIKPNTQEFVEAKHDKPDGPWSGVYPK